MDNEIARMAKYVLRGIPTNDATLMVDEIIEVGSEEDFLSRMSTLKLMREHQSKAGLIDRRVREEWEMDGSTDLYTRCNEKAKELVAEPQGRPSCRATSWTRSSAIVDEGREGRRRRLTPEASATEPRRKGQRILWQTSSLSRR